MADHVLRQISVHRERYATLTDGVLPPLLVGVQGPQGSGKTFLSNKLYSYLSSDPYRLSVAVISVDDLYLPHAGLVALAQAHPNNPLLRGRGQPGTHDVSLGTKILHDLRGINSSNAPVELPIFDKSLHDGEGDRLAEFTVVHPPLDVVIMEGWFIGFCPISEGEMRRRYDIPVTGLARDFFTSNSYYLEHISDINERLRDYVAWWPLLDVFVQVSNIIRCLSFSRGSGRQLVVWEGA
jgi:D-glycerate 3-kinase